MEHLLPIECSEEEFAALMNDLPDPAKRYSILRKATQPKASAPINQERVVLRPEKPVTETVATIRLEGKLITASLTEKREDFRQVVKLQCNMEFDWDRRHWYRKINQFAGEPRHRVVELCHRLLAANFVIGVATDWVEDIRAGNYELEQTRWIKRIVDGSRYSDWFSVTWGRFDDFYEVAIRLPGAHYHGDGRCVAVPAIQFEAVLDFAESREFEMSEGALEILAKAKAQRDAEILTCVDKPKPRKRIVAQGERPVLVAAKTEEIDSEFADDLV